MAKQTGLGDQLYIGGYDVGADISAIGSLSTPRTALDATGITKFANERLYGLTDAQGEITSYFNDATDQVFDALKGLPTTDVHLMYLRGEGVARPGFCTVAKQIGYDPTRGDDGSLTFGTAFQGSAYGGDWGLQLTAGRQTDATATNGTTVDTLAAASFGFQAYIQVFSLGSGTADIEIEDSADGVAWASVLNGQFNTVAGRTAQRIASASETATVRRYVRVITSGVFTDLDFAVVINKNAGLRAVS